jgi:hypothetical protein
VRSEIPSAVAISLLLWRLASSRKAASSRGVSWTWVTCSAGLAAAAARTGFSRSPHAAFPLFARTVKRRMLSVLDDAQMRQQLPYQRTRETVPPSP